MDTGELEFMDIDESGDFIDSAVGETSAPVKPQTEKIIDSLEDELVDFGDLELEDEQKYIPPEAKGGIDDNLSSPNKSLYLNLAKALSEKGVINDFEEDMFNDEEGDGVSTLMTLMQKTVDDSISEYRSQFGDSTMKIIEAIEQGLPIDEFLAAKNKQLNYNKITEDSLDDDGNLNTRKSILKDYYKNTTKFSDERIEKEINRIVQLGDDVEESKEALSRLKEIESEAADSILEKTKQSKLDASKKYQDSLIELRKETDEIDLSFLGISTNKTSRNKIYDMLTKPVGEENGVPVNAINKKRTEIGSKKFDIILAALLDKGVFDGNLSGISAKQRKGAIEELERSVNENRGTLANKGGRQRNNSDTDADYAFLKKRT